MRARITRELIAERGFTFVASKADWPDVGADRPLRAPFRSPRLRNGPPSRVSRPGCGATTRSEQFVDWLRDYNAPSSPEPPSGFHGLDLYSLHNSIAPCSRYLDGVDRPSRRVARDRYGCLTPWQGDPAAYGRAVLTGATVPARRVVRDAARHARADGSSTRCATASAISTRYRTRVLLRTPSAIIAPCTTGRARRGTCAISHMFETLKALLAFYGPETKAIVWAHNSHVGDASATEMAIRGEHNVGQLCRRTFGDGAFLVGFGTDRGTVAAASDWDGPMQVKSRADRRCAKSYERLCHAAAEETSEARFCFPCAGILRLGSSNVSKCPSRARDRSDLSARN